MLSAWLLGLVERCHKITHREKKINVLKAALNQHHPHDGGWTPPAIPAWWGPVPSASACARAHHRHPHKPGPATHS